MNTVKPASMIFPGLCSVLMSFAFILPSRAQSVVRPATTAEIAGTSMNDVDANTLGKLSKMNHYDLDLTLTDDLKTFSVKETVRFTNTSATALSNVIFHLANNAKSVRGNLTEDRFKVSAATVDGVGTTVTLEESILQVKLPKALAPNETALISFDLKGSLLELPSTPTLVTSSVTQLVSMLTGGHEKSTYGVFGLSDEIASMDRWYAAIPHLTSSGFDVTNPGDIGDTANFDAANFDVRINHPKGVVVAASGSPVAQQTADESKPSQWQAAGIRDFAVLASKRFQKVSREAGGTRVHVFVTPEHASKADFILDVGINSLKHFNQLFGEYPYKDLSIVEASLRGGAGGMEYSNLVTISRQFLMPTSLNEIPMLSQLMESFDAKANINIEDILKDSLEFTTAHEVAHQWWHGLVGNDEKHEPFVDESLTNYSTILYFEKRYGIEKAKKQELIQFTLSYQLYRMGGGEDVAVNQPTKSFKDSAQYGAIVYGKGALLYRELRKTLGDEGFFRFLKEYATSNRYGFVTSGDLESQIKKFAVTAKSGTSDQVGTIFTRWTSGVNGDKDIGKFGVSNIAEMFLGEDAFKGPEGAILKQLMDGVNL